MATEQIPSITIDWLPLVALLCFASVLFLVFCVRKYFASRAREARLAESVQIAPRIELPRASDAVERNDAVEESFSKIVQTWSASPLPPADQAYLCNAEDQRESAPGDALARMHDVIDVREAVSARVALDRASARGLRDLVRALYLDQSNFRFHVIADLQPEDRALARALIEKWMTDPTAIEYWESIYAGVCDSPDALRADRGTAVSAATLAQSMVPPLPTRGMGGE